MKQKPLYRPGIRGWWAFIRWEEILLETHNGNPAEAIRLLRRLRPSARLRQSNQEREYWRDQALTGETEGL